MTNKEIGDAIGKTASSVMNKLASMELRRGKGFTENLEGERWRRWSDRYLMSNHGRIFSLKYNKLIITEVTNKGYVAFNEYLVPGTRQFKKYGKKRKSLVHVLVAILFIKKPDEAKKSEILLEVNHRDGNKENNLHTNLEWVTHKKNIQHAVESGLHANFKHGQENPLNIHPDSVVHEVCKRIKEGQSDRMIAANMSLNRDYVYRIRNKKRSKKISDLYF